MAPKKNKITINSKTLKLKNRISIFLFERSWDLENSSSKFKEPT